MKIPPDRAPHHDSFDYAPNATAFMDGLFLRAYGPLRPFSFAEFFDLFLKYNTHLKAHEKRVLRQHKAYFLAHKEAALREVQKELGSPDHYARYGADPQAVRASYQGATIPFEVQKRISTAAARMFTVGLLRALPPELLPPACKTN